MPPVSNTPWGYATPTGVVLRGSQPTPPGRLPGYPAGGYCRGVARARSAAMATLPARPDGIERRVRNRLRRVGGQVRAIERMMSEGRSCEEIVTQLLAARSALDELTRVVLSERVSECLATLPPEDAQATITRAI